MRTDEVIGPWEATAYSGYSSRYWTLTRVNNRWMSGRETMMTRSCNPRRFKTELAATAAADKANRAAAAIAKEKQP